MKSQTLITLHTFRRRSFRSLFSNQNDSFMNFITRISLVLVALFCMAATVHAQQVRGTVTSTEGEPLVGVSILVKGTTTGTVTDFDGGFSVDLPEGSSVLVFSYTGYATREVDVTEAGNQLDIILDDDVANLNEVVVTGLASSVKRTNLANAVSTVSAEELAGVTSQQTVDGALYGKLTGANIVQTTGAPGGGFALRLRGISSLSGNNQPLIIVDGVYFTNTEIPNGSRFASGANSGSEEGSSNRLADLNPDDIESIEVLKGASAAAIYGTRANAGVVIITTKRGTSGQTNISVNQDLGINRIINFVGRRSFTPQQVEDEFSAAERARFEAAQAAGEIFDYEEEIYGETGFITDTRLRISGGNEKTNFFISGSWRDEDGIIKNTGYERLTARINIQHRISDKFSVAAYSNYINSTADRSFTGNENEGGLSYGYALAFTKDWVNLFPDENGVYPNNPDYPGNPIFVRDNTINEENIDRFVQGVNAEFRFLQTDNQVLKAVFNGGLDFLFNETYVYVPENHQAQVGVDNGFIGQGKNNVFNYNYNLLGVYDYFTNSGINFTTQAGISYLNFNRDFVLNRTTQLIPGQTALDQGGAQQTDQTRAEEEEFGIIAQEEVNWQDKIIGTVGIRLDKSSLNGDPNEFFAFPKASLAVNLANFDFWNVDFANQVKLRVAYGETGNSASFGSLYTALVPTNINGRAGFINSAAQGDANITPETSSELEFGADLSLFSNKLGLTVTYYIRQVEDLIYSRSLPASTGFSSEIRNDLELENTGLEISLNIQPVRSTNFNWTSTVNFWFNDSEVTRLGVPDGDDDPNDIPSFTPPGVAFGLGLGTFFVDEGSPITALFGNGADGPEIIGDVEPDFQLSWYNQFNIVKNLDISFLTHWKQGGDGLNLSRLLTDIGGTTPREFDDLEGFIEDASYFRIRELGAYYTIPLQSQFIKNVRLGVSGRNILTITDYSSYDPETSTKGTGGLSTGIEVTPFPTSRQYYFHLRFNF